MTALTRKNAHFEWSDACKKSFYELKQRVVTALMLTLPTKSKGFGVYFDTSKKGLVVFSCRMGVAYAS